ncbi:hypothetical protein SAY87_028558 [Trapa incisa]|uniref:Uncharacterized protein n=1 Tax=Trapa incisa TaxID=236973 RepID=A0AAN7QNT4_9MYRT|nr:hypothetical protein SAY87_028558 [Trapa incisa]
MAKVGLQLWVNHTEYSIVQSLVELIKLGIKHQLWEAASKEIVQPLHSCICFPTKYWESLPLCHVPMENSRLAASFLYHESIAGALLQLFISLPFSNSQAGEAIWSMQLKLLVAVLQLLPTILLLSGPPSCRKASLLL